MSKRKLFTITIADCRVDTFTVGGHGGSGKDTSNTGVRITHVASGAVGKATDMRSQLKNKQLAFRRMAESDTFQAWVRREAAMITSMRDLYAEVEEAMKPSNIKVEVNDGERWVEIHESKP